MGGGAAPPARSGSETTCLVGCLDGCLLEEEEEGGNGELDDDDASSFAALLSEPPVPPSRPLSCLQSRPNQYVFLGGLPYMTSTEVWDFYHSVRSAMLVFLPPPPLCPLNLHGLSANLVHF